MDYRSLGYDILLNSVVRVGLMENVMSDQRLEVKELAKWKSGGRMFQREWYF